MWIVSSVVDRKKSPITKPTVYSAIFAVTVAGCGPSNHLGVQTSAATSTDAQTAVSSTVPTTDPFDDCSTRSTQNGCIADSTNTSGAAQPTLPTPIPAVECSIYTTQSDCEADHRCVAVAGAVVVNPGDCVMHEEFLSCEAARPCGPELMHARDPSGRVWRFRSTCIPRGWEYEDVQVPAIRECGNPSPCPALAETECIRDIRCVPVNAWRIDVSRRCLGRNSDFFACMDLAQCSSTALCVADASGQLLQTASNCFPSSWRLHDWFVCYPYMHFLCETGS